MAPTDRSADSGGDRGGRRPLARVVTTVLVLLGGSATAAAGVLAGLRVVAPPSRRAVELVAFTPVGLPLAVLGIVAAALLALGRARRRTALVLAVPALVLGLLHAWWLAPFYTGAVPAAADGGRLVVMTQNFEQGDPGAVAELVRRHDVDVLVLTDSSRELAEPVHEAIGQDLPFTTLGADDTSLGTVVWSRHPTSAHSLISDGGDSRSMVLEVAGLGRVDLVAVHPTPPYHGDATAWRQDWDRILERLDTGSATSSPSAGTAAPAGLPTVVVGDFNATADHEPMTTLADRGLRDAAEQLNRGLVPTWPANGLQERLGVVVPPLLVLDHVVTGPQLTVTDLEVTGAAGSDHRAVIATLAPSAR